MQSICHDCVLYSTIDVSSKTRLLVLDIVAIETENNKRNNNAQSFINAVQETGNKSNKYVIKSYALPGSEYKVNRQFFLESWNQRHISK